MVSFDDPYTLPKVYHRNADKDDFWTPGVLGSTPSLVQTLDQRTHSRKRRVLEPFVSGYRLAALVLDSDSFRQMSMRNLTSMEQYIDQSVSKVLKRIMRGMALDRNVNVSNTVKYNLQLLQFPHANVLRSYASDATSDLLYGQHAGLLEHENDDLGLLSSLHHSSWLLGLMAMFPYIIQPLRKLRAIRFLFFPRTGNKTGLGKSMAVSTLCCLYHDPLRQSYTSRRRVVIIVGSLGILCFEVRLATGTTL